MGKILTDCPGLKIQWFVGIIYVYKDVWDVCSDISKVLESIREPGNRSDIHAVAVKKGELTVAWTRAKIHITDMLHFYSERQRD